LPVSGAFDLGFERAGMVCKWQVEIDHYCQKVLAKHWPSVRRHDDIKTFPPTKPEEWQVDVICGGFPCQDISYAGKGAGLAGERSGLFYEAIRVVREVGPRVVVLENVAGLLTRGIDQVLGTLASIGFDAEWHCIPAAAVGAPHIRDRLFLVAYAKHGRLSKRWGTAMPTKTDDTARVSRNEREGLRIKASALHADTNSGGLKECKECNGEPKAWSQAQQRDDALRCGVRGWWEAEPDVGRVVNGLPNRAHRLRGLGNAVVPQVAEYVGRIVVDALGE